MTRRRAWFLTASLLALTPALVRAQLPILVSGAAGGAFNTDENVPGGSSGGFAWLSQVGVRLAHVGLGGELAAYNTGSDAKSWVYGGYARFPSYIGDSPAQIYLTLGLGVYRFSPTGGKSSTTAGGSVGPGVSLGPRRSPLAFMIEVRFHSTFDRLPRINNQQFLAALAGVELRL